MKILLIEDEAGIANMIRRGLTDASYVVETAADGKTGLEMALSSAYALVILDLMLPKMDGWQVCEELRANRNRVPVLMLTARDNVEDRVKGLDLGADDYLPKPFDPRELLARLRTVLRRGNAPVNPVLRFGRLEIDREARQVRLDGQSKTLTGYQFDILLALAERAGKVVSRNHLLDAIAGRAMEAFDRTIDVHISNIRAAIEDNPRQPRRILTLRGVGYLFTRVQDDGEQA